jgi:hypothetical protein
MAERKLEVTTKPDNRVFFYTFPLPGFGQMAGFYLKFVSGPPLTKDVKPGSWLQHWATVNGKREFLFGPERVLGFASEEAAIAAKEELEKAVDIITEVST